MRNKWETRSTGIPGDLSYHRKKLELWRGEEPKREREREGDEGVDFLFRPPPLQAMYYFWYWFIFFYSRCLRIPRGLISRNHRGSLGIPRDLWGSLRISASGDLWGSPEISRQGSPVCLWGSMGISGDLLGIYGDKRNHLKTKKQRRKEEGPLSQNLNKEITPVVPHKAVAEVLKRGWLLWITDGRAKPLMDSKVLDLSLSLFLSLSLSFSLFLSVSLSFSDYLPTYLLIYLSIYLSVCLSVCLPIPLSIYLSIYLSTYLSI